MSKEKIEIEVPEGYTAKFNPETMKIELVKKNNRPKTWAEFCANFPHKEGEAYISSTSMIMPLRKLFIDLPRTINSDKNLCTSEEEAAAFLALMQLRQLRKVWVEDWEPDWCELTLKWCIYFHDDVISIISNCRTSRILSFPKEEMAKEFLECFRDLIETAKILL